MANSPFDIIREQLAIAEESAGLAAQTKADQVQFLCDLIGISRRELAAGILISNPDITTKELADRVGTSRQILYKWPEIAKALRTR